METQHVSAESARVARLVHEALNPEFPWSDLQSERRDAATLTVAELVAPLVNEIIRLQREVMAFGAKRTADAAERMREQRLRLLGQVGSEIVGRHLDGRGRPSEVLTSELMRDIALASARVADALLTASELPFQTPSDDHAARPPSAQQTLERAQAEGLLQPSDLPEFQAYVETRSGGGIHLLSHKQIVVLLNTWLRSRRG